MSDILICICETGVVVDVEWVGYDPGGYNNEEG